MSDELLERLRRLLAPRYEVYHEIGRGGMGIVYAGRHVLLDLRVAIKVLRPELASATAVERFLREPRVLAKLTHPNIVHVYDTSPETSELSYYVMEYLDGEWLDVRLTRGALTVKAAVALGRDLLAALEHAHKRGVVHRDVKPSNIVLVTGRAVLTDWGIAKACGDASLTAVGHLPGTLAYMAPELLAGAEATPQSDFYALGMVLFEATSGRPWEVGMQLEELNKAALPRWFARALRRALDSAPEKRWPDAASFAKALEPPLVPEGVKRAAQIALPLGAVIAAARMLCAPLGLCSPDQNFDIAVFPWEIETQGDPSIGRTLPRMAALPLRFFPRVRLVDAHTSFNCWDRHSRTAGRDSWFRNCPFRSRLYVQGRVVVSGDAVDVTLYLLDGGRVASPRLAGTMDSLHVLADHIGIELVRAVEHRLDSLYRATRRWPTPVPEALSEFAQGEEDFQRDDWVPAEAHYRRALALDPDFALAGWQLANVQRWRRIPVTVNLPELRGRADSSFPPLVRLLIDAQLATSTAERMALYDTVMQRYPRDAYAALLYGGELHSRGALLGIPWDSAAEVFETAVRNDPALAPALSHLTWVRIRLGQREAARRALDNLLLAVRDPAGQEITLPQLLEVAYAARFGVGGSGPSPPLGSLAQAVRFSLAFDIPEAQARIGATLAGAGTLGDSVRANGHEAQGLALVALGRAREAISQFDSAAMLFGSPAAQVEAAEWRVLLSPLGLPIADSAVPRAGEARLRLWLNDSALGARAAWALGMAANARRDTFTAKVMVERLRSRPPRDTAAARLAQLLDAFRAAARGRPDGALRVTAPLLPFDSAGRNGDPFARAALHLGRGTWYLALDSASRAEREWIWFENADVVDWPTGSAHAGDVDWALGTYARLLLGRIGRAADGPEKACRGVTRAAELWVRADPALAALKREADSLAAECRR